MQRVFSLQNEKTCISIIPLCQQISDAGRAEMTEAFRFSETMPKE